MFYSHYQKTGYEIGLQKYVDEKLNTFVAICQQEALEHSSCLKVIWSKLEVWVWNIITCGHWRMSHTVWPVLYGTVCIWYAAYDIQHMICRIYKLTQPRNTQIKAWHVPWLINPLLELLVYIQTSNSSFIEMKLSKFSPLQTVIYSIHDDFGWNLIN